MRGRREEPVRATDDVHDRNQVYANKPVGNQDQTMSTSLKQAKPT